MADSDSHPRFSSYIELPADPRQMTDEQVAAVRAALGEDKIRHFFIAAANAIVKAKDLENESTPDCSSPD